MLLDLCILTDHNFKRYCFQIIYDTSKVDMTNVNVEMKTTDRENMAKN